MIIDQDFSFLRLRDNMADAFDLNESASVTHEYVGQVHLIPSESYVQISNSPTDIIFSGNWEVFLVNNCGIEIVDATSNIFIEEFIDSNGITQIKWEFVNEFELFSQQVSLRFKNTVNNDTWYTNLFITTNQDKKLTTRFDYEGVGFHYGTQYDRANVSQSIRLCLYFKNLINESEKSEYHQTTTDVTVPTRNIRKFKRRYIFPYMDDFSSVRLDTLSSTSKIYVDTVRMYNTEPIEFLEQELDSNAAEGEIVFNPDFTDIFTFENQIYQGLKIIQLDPANGSTHTLASLVAKIQITFNQDITINTGTLTVFDSSNVVISTFTEADMFLFSPSSLRINSTFIFINGVYHIKFDAGLVSSLGQDFEGINNNTDWVFTVQDADYSAADYSNDYLI